MLNECTIVPGISRDSMNAICCYYYSQGRVIINSNISNPLLIPIHDIHTWTYKPENYFSTVNNSHNLKIRLLLNYNIKEYANKLFFVQTIMVEKNALKGANVINKEKMEFQIHSNLKRHTHTYTHTYMHTHKPVFLYSLSGSLFSRFFTSAFSSPFKFCLNTTFSERASMIPVQKKPSFSFTTVLPFFLFSP